MLPCRSTSIARPGRGRATAQLTSAAIVRLLTGRVTSLTVRGMVLAASLLLLDPIPKGANVIVVAPPLLADPMPEPDLAWPRAPGGRGVGRAKGDVDRLPAPPTDASSSVEQQSSDHVDIDLVIQRYREKLRHTGKLSKNEAILLRALCNTEQNTACQLELEQAGIPTGFGLLQRR